MTLNDRCWWSRACGQSELECCSIRPDLVLNPAPGLDVEWPYDCLCSRAMLVSRVIQENNHDVTIHNELRRVTVG